MSEQNDKDLIIQALQQQRDKALNEQVTLSVNLQKQFAAEREKLQAQIDDLKAKQAE